MSGTPVLLDVTDTPGEKGEVSVRQQPVGQRSWLVLTPAGPGGELQWSEKICKQTGLGRQALA